MMRVEVMARREHSGTDEQMELIVMLPNSSLALCQLPELQAQAAFAFGWLEVEEGELSKNPLDE